MSFLRFGNLFGASSPLPEGRVEGRVPRGIRLVPEFAGPREQHEITEWIAANVAWSCGSYQGNRMETWLEPGRRIPEWGQALGRRMQEAGLFEGEPDYLHLISYHAGQGIARHVDRDELGEVVAGLTLGSSRVLEFAHKGREEAFARLLLMPGDLYTFSGPAWRRWEHGVPFVKEDHFGGRIYARSEGWSASWRRVIRDSPLILEHSGSETAIAQSGAV